MKRTEMVGFMEKAWKEYVRNMDRNSAGVWNACNYLLQEMEARGMIPPEYERPGLSKEKAWVPRWTSVAMTNGWEPEDEK